MIISRISRLYLRNFRSYETLDGRFTGGINLLYGANGAGKTNLLEALHVLITGKSPRAGRDADLLRWGSQQWLVKGLWHIDGREQTLEATYLLGQGKAFRRNGQAVTWSEANGLPTVVYFAPESLQLIKGGPAHRRAFLDGILTQLFPAYRRELSRYQQALAQRNDLLKEIRSGRAPRDLLAAWDEQLVREAAPLWQRRTDLLEAVRPLAGAELVHLAAGEVLEMVYVPGLPDAAAGPPAADALRAALTEHRQEELAKGHTQYGPHRDELALRLNGQDAKLYASQGQQRSLALALALASERLLAERTGLTPILLFDDIFSELDVDRRQRLIELLNSDRQAFLTTTNADAIPAWLAGHEVQRFRVEGGALHAGGTD